VRNVRKNLNLFVDGRGHAGQIESFTAPKLTLKTEEFRGGGMHAPVDITMGHEKLATSFVLLSDDPDVLATFGVVEGVQTQLTAREALESIDGATMPVVHSMRGKVTEIDRGESKPGEKATTNVTASLTYYKLTHGARIIHEIDVVNMVWIRDGIDMLEATRAALGI
jgi:P2 family phage contractile tail tube protein